MKEVLSQYAAYNLWANQKLITLVLGLDESKQDELVKSSFPGLKQTLLHIWDAENIWWQRMKLQERIIVPSENFKGTMKDLVNELNQQSRQWYDWVVASTESSLDHVFHYYNKEKEHFKMPIYQMLHHVFNHGTYHRGQLINMLRQLGMEKLPSTDFSTWTRTLKK